MVSTHSRHDPPPPTLQVDAAYHSTQVCQGDNVPLRLLKWLRDGSTGPTALVAAAAVAARSIPDLTRTASGVAPRVSQAACEAPLNALAAVLEATAFGYRQQATCGYGPESRDPLSPGSVTSSGAAPVPALGPCPALCAAAAGELQSWVDCVRARVAAVEAAATAASRGRPLPSTLQSAAAAAAAMQQEPSPAPYSQGALPLGTATLALVRALCALLGCPWPEVVAAVAQSGLLGALLDLQLAFPWHSVLHATVTAALSTALSHGPPALLRALLIDAGLPQRIVAGCRFAGLPGSMRAQFAPFEAAPAAAAAATAVAAPAAVPKGRKGRAVAAAAAKAKAAADRTGQLGRGGGHTSGRPPLRAGYGGSFVALANLLLALEVRG
jgi:hypothetical protein